ncbi:MAG: hypothetical protein CMC01_04650 [Flavobacteriaceae bacterium]|nr:hypothetical protein [Flavobacteriaceae bacterium]|tara:strand:+ start:4369 stop:4902 length:534 start_codon:yes stop_codon:yes gene_type:complete
MAQGLPFSSIPITAESYSAGTSISRMIQGLGFRYYWATEGLKAQDLSYRPSSEAQNTIETIQHIFQLSKTILNAAKNNPSLRPAPKPPADLSELRKATLNDLKEAAAIFENSNETQLKHLKIIFERGGGKQSKFPVWNLINGPIADAIYHTGQVVSFRRTSGNPIAKGVNVFLGVRN